MPRLIPAESDTRSIPFGSSGGGGTVEVEVPIPVAGEIIFIAAAPTVWTNMPLALTEIFGNINCRKPWDFNGYTQVRLCVGGGVSGAAAAVLRGQYSIDGGSNWLPLDGGTGPSVSIASLGGTTATTIGSLVNLTTAAKEAGDVLVRIVGVSGDGAADPTFSLVSMECIP